MAWFLGHQLPTDHILTAILRGKNQYGLYNTEDGDKNMLVCKKNIPVIEYDASGNPLKPYHYLDGAWNKYIERVKKCAIILGWPQREVIDNDVLASLPPIRRRLGRNKWAHYISENDYRKVLEGIIEKGHMPTHTRIARGLGISVSTLKRYARMHWHITLPHSQPYRKYLSGRLNGRFFQRGTV